MRHRRRLTSALLAGVAAWGAATSANAHGGIPRAWNIFLEPGNESHIILRSDIWGLFQTADGGQTWEWVCSEAYRGRSLVTQRLSVVMLPGGAVLIANRFQGLQLSRTGSSCDFEGVPQFESEVVQDVVLTEKDGSRLHVLTSTGSTEGLTTRIWESTDGGETWDAVGALLPSDFGGTSLLYAPSDPSRVYVSGKRSGETANGVIQRSLDGGDTWESFAVPVSDEESWAARLYAIDPHDPDVVYFYKDRHEGGGGDIQPDQLWISSNAGETFTLAFDAVGDMPGFALSPDGTKVILSGPEDGVFRADTEALVRDGRSAFTQVFDQRVWGVTWTESGLFAGNDDFSAGDTPKFTLGVSRDEGATYEPLMQICDTNLVACPEGSRAATVCEERYSEPGGFLEDFLEGPRCVPLSAPPPPPPDAGDVPDEPKTSGGCNVGERPTSGAALFALFLALVAGVLRRR